ncbi:MAG: hypothetical protein IJL37_03610 [Bacteroidaceae bacterium]|nr:hypothetical protein [Bacteroidaceae bacterium]
MSNQNFIAVDFETATNTSRMACQVGITIVKDGIIKDTIVRLIQPPHNEYEPNCINVHHIVPEMTEKAPTFDKVWQEISHLFIDTTIVAHNASFDEDVLYKNLSYYGILPIGINKFECTYCIYNHNLHDLCQSFGMSTQGHHDAGFDSRCCAQFYLNHLNGVKPDYNLINKENNNNFSSHVALHGDVLQKDLSEANPNNPFFDRKLVITGEFDIDRIELAEKLKKMGADIDTTITKRTSYVIIGSEPGPKKMEKLEELINSGNHIVKIYPSDLERIFNGEWNNYMTVKPSLVGKDPNHPLYDRRVFITGKWGNRTNFKKLLESYGAEVEDQITKYVTHVFIGQDPKEEDLNNIQKLEFNGFHFCRLYQNDFDNLSFQIWDPYRTPFFLKKELDFSIQLFEQQHIRFDGMRNIIASKELYYGKGFKEKVDCFYQIAGNLGAFGNWDLNNDVDICVLSNSTINKLRDGIKDETIKYIEDTYNKNNADQFNYKFLTEQDILDYCKSRCDACDDDVTMHYYNVYINS